MKGFDNIESDGRYMPLLVNNGFWDKSPDERSFIMNRACENAGEVNFFDLDPSERAAAYDTEY